MQNEKDKSMTQFNKPSRVKINESSDDEVIQKFIQETEQFDTKKKLTAKENDNPPKKNKLKWEAE